MLSFATRLEMPDLKSAYGLSDSLGGILLAVYSAGNLLAGLFSGLVPLYLGQRRAIMLLAALAYLGYLMLTLTGSPLFLLVAFAMIGFGKGSVTSFDNRMVNQLSCGSPAASNILHAQCGRLADGPGLPDCVRHHQHGDVQPHAPE